LIAYFTEYMKTDRNKLIRRIFSLVFVLVLLSLIAAEKSKRIMGHEVHWAKEDQVTLVSDTATLRVLDEGIVLVNSTNIAKDVTGYAGPIPMKLWIREGIIDSIEVLENQETPDFLACVLDELIPQYRGQKVSDALSAQVDAVSGATYSSECFKSTIHRALAQVPETMMSKQDVLVENEHTLNFKDILAILVIVIAGILPLFVKNKWYRTIQLLINILVMGLYLGIFLNFTSLVGLFSNGVSLSMLPIALMFIIAFIYPLFGKKGHYCAWCCPLGSAQELMGKTRKCKVNISPAILKYLKNFNRLLFYILVVLALTGIYFDWMNYELFSAFIWDSASCVILVCAILTLILSIFINRPYCRFICPTGYLMRI